MGSARKRGVVGGRGREERGSRRGRPGGRGRPETGEDRHDSARPDYMSTHKLEREGRLGRGREGPTEGVSEVKGNYCLLTKDRQGQLPTKK